MAANSLSGIIGGGKPIKVTQYTPGQSGTHTLQVTPCWCRVTLVGAGGSGGRSSTGSATLGGGGGCGGQVHQAWVRFDSNPTYAAAAANTTTTSVGSGANGGATTLGPLYAEGGYGGAGSSSGTGGAGAGLILNSTTHEPVTHAINGGGGGQGGASGANAGKGGR